MKARIRAKTAGGSAGSRLIEAIRSGDTDSVVKALQAGADVNAPGQGLADGSILWATPLIETADQDRPRIAELLIDAGADVNWQVPMTSWRDCGYTALIIAAWRGHAAVVEVLLEAGADMELKASDPQVIGGRALHYAVRGGDPECVRLLVSAGADVTAKTGDQRTAIALAKGARSREIAQALAGGKPKRAARGQNLMEAATAGNITLVKQFLADGASVNTTDISGDSVLTNAALYGQKKVVKLLLAAKADPNRGRKRRPTVLMHAAQNDWPELVAALLAAGAEVNRVSSERQTALDLAVEFGAERSARVLRKAGGKSANEVAPQKIKIPRAMAEDTVPMAALPDLRRAGKSKAFLASVRQIERRARTSARQTEQAGVMEFDVPGNVALRVMKDHQAELPKKGSYLVIRRKRLSESDRWTLWLLASDRWEDVIAAAQTNGQNLDIGSRKIISQLGAIARQNSFVLSVADFDLVEGRFANKVKAAEEIARRIGDLAPDVISQGTDTLERLVEWIEEEQQFWLWWD